MQKQKTAKVAKIIGIILLVLGLAMVILGVGYELFNHPWGYKNAPVAVETLPEPAPISIGYSSFYQEDFVGQKMPESVPASDSGIPLSRPDIPLYRLGSLKIPRLAISEHILEGADNEILYGIGHVSGTPLPSELGNFSVAGHRSYLWMHPFRHLDKLQMGDTVVVQMDGEDSSIIYTYEIYKYDTVLPEDTWVMDTQPEAEQTIALITCTPIPSYSHRLIYWGELIDVQEVN